MSNCSGNVLVEDVFEPRARQRPFCVYEQLGDGRRIAFESGNSKLNANELWLLENIPAAAESTVASAR